MTLVLLDTNAYLRLAKRVKPILGVKFGQKDYIITILKDVEDEVHRNSKLAFKFPWFDNTDIANERLATRTRLNNTEQQQLNAAASVLHGWVLSHIYQYNNPPSYVDCRVLAFGQIRQALVVTDDLSMHTLANQFGIPVWHGHELLKRMHTAKFVSSEQVREIYSALETNQDLPAAWEHARKTHFAKILGK